MLSLEYRQDKPMLKASEPKTKFLAKMGQARKDGHYFHPEEALYLTENNIASVLSDRKRLHLRQVYSLTAARGISMLKYAAYAQMVRAGYTIRRAGEISTPSTAAPLQLIPMTGACYRFPEELLNQFPNVAADLKTVHIPEVKMEVPLLGEFNMQELIGLQESAKATTTYSTGQRDNAPWVNLRPAHWPVFDSLRNAGSWRIYEKQRDQLIKSASRSRYIPPPRRAGLMHDYDVFTTTGSKVDTLPNYRLLAIDERFNFSMPDLAVMSRLAKESSVPLLIATGPPSEVRISQFGVETEESMKPRMS